MEIIPSRINPIPLKKIIEKKPVDEKYFLTEKQVEKFAFMRGSKKIPRKRPNGEEYFYSEGPMSPYDSLDLPARTMLTSEGGANRSTHIVMDPFANKLRFLTPLECERINGFPDNWTNTGMPHNFRYFCMGNALVVPMISRMAKKILKLI